MNKVCKDCNIEKTINNFHPNGKYFSSYCISCCAIRTKKWKDKNKQKELKNRKEYYNKKKLNRWIVYCLPNSDYYVGQTSLRLKDRFRQHRYIGNDTSDYIKLHRCTTEQEAREYEKIYHKLGFPGKKMA